MNATFGLLALAAAACFATSSVAQHRAASTLVVAGSGLRLAVRLAAHPIWLLGLLAGGLGFVLQGLALARGPLVVVQLVLVAGLLLALPAAVVLERRRPAAREWLWAGAVAAGLLAFLGGSRPAPGAHLADPTTLLVGSACCAAVVVGAALLARLAGARYRALLLGLGGGAALGLASALLKQVVGELGLGPVHPLVHWPLYALLGAGAGGIALTQASYRAGVLAASQPAITIAEPLAAAVLGALAFGEHLDHSPGALALQVVGVVAMVCGVVGLARSAQSGDRDPPAPPYPPAPPDIGEPDRPPGEAVLTHPSVRPGVTAHDRAPQPRRSVLIVSGSVGAGHDGAARELAERLRRAGIDVDIRDHLAALPRLFRFLLRDGYTLSVGKIPAFFEWLFLGIERSVLMRALLTLFCAKANRDVRRWVNEKPYSAVVSTFPLASQTLGALRARGSITVPVVTYLTDPAAHRSWVHEAVDHHWTVTPATAAQGSADYGVAMRAVGPLVPSRFAASPDDDARGLQVRRELGIDPAARVALIVTGSLGLGDVGHSAAAVAAAGFAPLVLCGRNDALRERVGAIPGVLALGWRTDVHELMRATDVLVHNAGGLSFTEALVAGVPAVSYRCIPGHGLANATVLEGAGLAPWARTDAELAGALGEACARGRLAPDLDDPARHVVALVLAPASSLVLLPSPRTSPVRSGVVRAGSRTGWAGSRRVGTRRRPTSLSA